MKGEGRVGGRSPEERPARPRPARPSLCARPFAHSTAHCTALLASRHSFLCPCAPWECRRAPTLAIDHRMIVSPARSLYWRWMDAASGSLDQLASHGLDLERAILWRRRQRVAAAQGPSNAIQFQSKLSNGQSQSAWLTIIDRPGAPTCIVHFCQASTQGTRASRIPSALTVHAQQA